MRKPRVDSRASLLALGLVLGLAIPAGAEGGESSWLTSHDQAVARARATAKPILIEFTGSDWCKWCVRQRQEVWENGAFHAWAAKNVILLRADFPKRTRLEASLREQNHRLAERYSIGGYPTFVFVDADGNELGRLGYDKAGATSWLQRADAVLAAQRAPTWLVSLDAAKREAARRKLPILVRFSETEAGGNGPRLRENVLESEAFRTWAADHVVLLRADGAKRPGSMRTSFGVEDLGTVLLLDAKAKELERIPYRGETGKAWVEARRAAARKAAAHATAKSR